MEIPVQLHALMGILVSLLTILARNVQVIVVYVHQQQFARLVIRITMSILILAHLHAQIHTLRILHHFNVRLVILLA